MTDETIRNIFVILPLLLQLLGLFFAVLVDTYIRAGKRRIMLMVLVIVLSLLVHDYTSYILIWKVPMPFVRILVSIYGYSVRPLVPLLLCTLVAGRRKMNWAWWPAGANALIHLTALFSGICFTIDAQNHFIRGPLGFSCHIVSMVYLAALVYMSVRERFPQNRGAWIPFLNALAILAATALDTSGDFTQVPVSFLTVTVVSCCVFYYIWLHLQFVTEHEQDLQAEQRIRIMMSQIQPHFLFNTISTIRALCRINPEQAGEVAEKFGLYLRRNIDSLAEPGLISFRKELEHTKLYADIEMIRFDNIRVEYDIRDDDFLLPALTVQPMVENAIRHGIRIRQEGIVTVRSRRAQSFHEIVVEDNGVGFDTGTLESAGGEHIGISNVRERIEKLCGGTFLLESRVGEGTTVTIRIPAAAE